MRNMLGITNSESLVAQFTNCVIEVLQHLAQTAKCQSRAFHSVRVGDKTDHLPNSMPSVRLVQNDLAIFVSGIIPTMQSNSLNPHHPTFSTEAHKGVVMTCLCCLSMLALARWILPRSKTLRGAKDKKPGTDAAKRQNFSRTMACR